MRKLLSISLLSIALITSCKKKDTIEYTVDCANCEVSYWDEDSEFVSRIATSGNWTYSFEAEEDNVLRISAQSQLCADINCNDTAASTIDQLAMDSVYVSIAVNVTIVEDTAVGNRKFATAMVETILDN